MQAVAKELDLPKFSSGRPCVKGHTALRNTQSRQCVECVRLNSRKQYVENKPRILSRNRAYQSENKIAIAAQKRERHRAAPGISAERGRRWRQRNPKRVAEANRKFKNDNPNYAADYARTHYRANRDVYIATAAKRRAASMRRTPEWSDDTAVAAIYRRAREQRRAGENVHVDHIIPLQGELVSGLHVPENLQIIPAAENLSKSNHFDVERQCA